MIKSYNISNGEMVESRMGLWCLRSDAQIFYSEASATEVENTRKQYDNILSQLNDKISILTGELSAIKSQQQKSTLVPTVSAPDRFVPTMIRNEAGQLHSEEQAALVLQNGTHIWMINGQISRKTGPAIIFPDGETRWYIDDIQLSEEEFNKVTKPSKKTTRKNKKSEVK